MLAGPLATWPAAMPAGFAAAPLVVTEEGVVAEGRALFESSAGPGRWTATESLAAAPPPYCQTSARTVLASPSTSV